MSWPETGEPGVGVQLLSGKTPVQWLGCPRFPILIFRGLLQDQTWEILGMGTPVKTGRCWSVLKALVEPCVKSLRS